MQTNTPSNFTLADGAGHTFFERDLAAVKEPPERADAEAFAASL
jgi:hypothetical protein